MKLPPSPAKHTALDQWTVPSTAMRLCAYSILRSYHDQATLDYQMNRLPSFSKHVRFGNQKIQYFQIKKYSGFPGK